MIKQIKSTQKPTHNPGALSREQSIARMIRVDHAGEYGAMRIYQGQLAVLGKTDNGPAIKKMAQQESQHLKIFETMITQRRVRPTALLPIWLSERV